MGDPQDRRFGADLLVQAEEDPAAVLSNGAEHERDLLLRAVAVWQAANALGKKDQAHDAETEWRRLLQVGYASANIFALQELLDSALAAPKNEATETELALWPEPPADFDGISGETMTLAQSLAFRFLGPQTEAAPSEEEAMLADAFLIATLEGNEDSLDCLMTLVPDSISHEPLAQRVAQESVRRGLWSF